jgi:hypothetical protein
VCCGHPSGKAGVSSNPGSRQLRHEFSDQRDADLLRLLGQDSCNKAEMMVVANMEYILVDKVADDMDRIKEKPAWYKWSTNIATLT